MNPPVVFLAFANSVQNPHAHYLSYLKEEYVTIKKMFEDKGFEVQGDGFSSLRDICDKMQSERYKDRICIFHFSGHADGYQVLLETQTFEANALVTGSTIVGFLKTFKHCLKLVFLNGCCTDRLAAELAASGIPICIGTYAPVSDQTACRLAERFYKGITEKNTFQQAWERALAFVDMTTDSPQNLSVGIVRKNEVIPPQKIYWGIHIAEGQAYMNDWVLSIQNQANTVMNLYTNLCQMVDELQYQQVLESLRTLEEAKKLKLESFEKQQFVRFQKLMAARAFDPIDFPDQLKTYLGIIKPKLDKILNT